MTEATATVIASTIVAAVSIVGILVNSWIAWKYQRRDWDRQRQWELKRDAVFEVLRDLCQFYCELHNLFNAFIGITDPDLEDASSPEKQQNVARKRFYSSNAKIRSSMFIAEMLVGKALSTALSEYYKAIYSAGTEVWDGNEKPYGYLHFIREQLANTVYAAARKELNINDLGQVVAEN